MTKSTTAVEARSWKDGKCYRLEAGENGRWSRIEALDSTAELPWIAPGLIDIQVNGFGGVDFNVPVTQAEMAQASTILAENGCTGFLATLITNQPETMERLLAGMEALKPVENGAELLGYHLEGPYLNPAPATRGAHPPELMGTPDPAWIELWQAAAQGRIKLITMAPEVHPEFSGPFIQEALRQEIRMSAGHSLAMGECLQGAVDAGVSCWTHLGNALGTDVPKFENVLFHVLAEERLLASLIPDGVHVPPHAFRVLARALGPRLLLTTDAMAAAGRGAGRYTLSGGTPVLVGEDGVPRLESGRLAGSGLTPIDGVFRASVMAELPWSECWEAFSTRPAAWVGVEHGLQVGCPADFCLLEPESATPLLATGRNGKVIYERNAA